MLDEKIVQVIVDQLFDAGGTNALAYYLQGSGGECISCRCKTPPHDNDCYFVKCCKEKLKGEK